MLAAIGWFAFVLLGGAALALAVRPALLRKPVLLVAVSPALAAALAYGAALGLNLLDVGPWPWVVMLQALVGIVAATRTVRWWRKPRAPESPKIQPEDRKAHRIAHWLLAGAVVTAAAVWLVPGSPTVPKNRDVQNHAYFVARISYENSVDPSVVLAESPTVDEQVADFYPLASHTSMAMTQRATGAPIEELLIVWTLMASMVTLPFGLFALARRLIPGRPAVAGWAALAGACMAAFPYQPIAWGGIALVVSLAGVPAVAALCLEAVDRQHSGRWELTFLAAIAIAGTSLVHTSQAAFLALLLGSFVLWDLIAKSADRAATMQRWGALAGLSAAFLAPLAVGVLAGADERASYNETLAESATDVTWRILAFDVGSGTTQLLMGLLSLAGVVVVVGGRSHDPPGRLWGLLGTAAVLVVLFASLTLAGPFWEALRPATLPWYTSWWRMPYYLAVLAPILAGLALGVGSDALARAWSPTRPALPAAAVAFVLVLVSAPTILDALDDAGVRSELLTGGQREMFERLAESTGDMGDTAVVLNQENDGSAWAYVTNEVPTFSVLQGFEKGDARDDRAWLLENAEHLADDPEVAAAFSELGIRWVLVRDNTYENETAQLTQAELSDAPGLELQDREASLSLFTVETGD